MADNRNYDKTLVCFLPSGGPTWMKHVSIFNYKATIYQILFNIYFSISSSASTIFLKSFINVLIQMSKSIRVHFLFPTPSSTQCTFCLPIYDEVSSPVTQSAVTTLSRAHKIESTSLQNNLKTTHTNIYILNVWTKLLFLCFKKN